MNWFSNVMSDTDKGLRAQAAQGLGAIVNTTAGMATENIAKVLVGKAAAIISDATGLDANGQFRTSTTGSAGQGIYTEGHVIGVNGQGAAQSSVNGRYQPVTGAAPAGNGTAPNRQQGGPAAQQQVSLAPEMEQRWRQAIQAVEDATLDPAKLDAARKLIGELREPDGSIRPPKGFVFTLNKDMASAKPPTIRYGDGDNYGSPEAFIQETSRVLSFSMRTDAGIKPITFDPRTNQPIVAQPATPPAPAPTAVTPPAPAPAPTAVTPPAPAPTPTAAETPKPAPAAAAPQAHEFSLPASNGKAARVIDGVGKMQISEENAKILQEQLMANPALKAQAAVMQAKGGKDGIIGSATFAAIDTVCKSCNPPLDPHKVNFNDPNSVEMKQFAKAATDMEKAALAAQAQQAAKAAPTVTPPAPTQTAERQPTARELLEQQAQQSMGTALANAMMNGFSVQSLVEQQMVANPLLQTQPPVVQAVSNSGNSQPFHPNDLVLAAAGIPIPQPKPIPAPVVADIPQVDQSKLGAIVAQVERDNAAAATIPNLSAAQLQGLGEIARGAERQATVPSGLAPNVASMKPSVLFTESQIFGGTLQPDFGPLAPSIAQISETVLRTPAGGDPSRPPNVLTQEQRQAKAGAGMGAG